MALTLYSHPAAPNAVKVHLFLEETGIPCPIKTLKLRSREHKRREHTALSPQGRVPYLWVDGQALFESNTILRFLADRFQKHEWYPVGTIERAHTDQWLDYGAQHINRWSQVYFWENLLGPRFFDLEPDRKALEEAEAKLHPELAFLNRHLAHRRFLVHHHPTIADLGLMSVLPLYEIIELPLRNYDEILSWVDRLRERVSWKNVAREAGYL